MSVPGEKKHGGTVVGPFSFIRRRRGLKIVEKFLVLRNSCVTTFEIMPKT